ncbi:hypothetical protein [Pseudomonas sp. OIL-1]|uniref:dCTP deaminase domain-containing protein n=1 Tax=Pseudomonas sp. OIL-1 TaxID=2706126 RepID=UPI0013A71490|nr:hypothetical protein [Pseudomonas sp. OIL-1]QIB52409.1 hypothetical protein G3M63_15985 [Pseudomonas sp. OIL-1]
MTTLADTEIGARMDSGSLIVKGSRNQIGPACYELRMGNVYYDLTESDSPIELPTKRGSRQVLIKPGHRVVLITQEELAIPNDVIARVSSKGSLFSIGLTPVSTYADPGFRGNLGIVTQNTSDKYITLPIGEPIAKIDFSLLASEAKTPYSGQHGFQTRIWPIRHQLVKSYKEIKDDPRVESEEAESYKILPDAMVTVLREIQHRQRWINICLLLTILINSLSLAAVVKDFVEIAVALAINLISAMLVPVVMALSKQRRI